MTIALCIHRQPRPHMHALMMQGAIMHTPLIEVAPHTCTPYMPRRHAR
jgi:hypothetical protein